MTFQQIWILTSFLPYGWEVLRWQRQQRREQGSTAHYATGLWGPTTSNARALMSVRYEKIHLPVVTAACNAHACTYVHTYTWTSQYITCTYVHTYTCTSQPAKDSAFGQCRHLFSDYEYLISDLILKPQRLALWAVSTWDGAEPSLGSPGRRPSSDPGWAFCNLQCVHAHRHAFALEVAEVPPMDPDNNATAVRSWWYLKPAKRGLCSCHIIL